MRDFPFRLSLPIQPNAGHTTRFEGVLKVRLAHGLGRSYIYPEQLFIELANHWRFFLPSFFGPNSIAFHDGHVVSCDTSMDVARLGQNRTVRLIIAINPQDLRYAYADGARLYGCTVTGPDTLIQQASGRASLQADGDFVLQLHHYTNGAAMAGIRRDANLRSSSWNLAGTRELANVSYCYFTTLPRVRNAEDLGRIAMATNGRLGLRTTSPTGEAEELLELEVYRGDTSNRRNRLTLHVPSRAVSPPHLLFHRPHMEPAYYECVCPEIVRIGLNVGCGLGFGADAIVSVVDGEMRTFDYLVEGDAASAVGIEAPYAEESTDQVIHLEALPNGDDPFSFWWRQQNTDQISERVIEARLVRPKVGDA